MGAAVGTLCVEALFLAPVSLHYVRVFTGFAPSYWAIVRMSAISIGVIWVVRTALNQGSIAAAAVAVVLYAVLALAFRVVRISDLRLLLHRESA
jgi:hypothetical protein